MRYRLRCVTDDGIEISKPIGDLSAPHEAFRLVYALLNPAFADGAFYSRGSRSTLGTWYWTVSGYRANTVDGVERREYGPPVEMATVACPSAPPRAAHQDATVYALGGDALHQAYQLAHIHVVFLVAPLLADLELTRAARDARTLPCPTDARGTRQLYHELVRIRASDRVSHYPDPRLRQMLQEASFAAWHCTSATEELERAGRLTDLCYDYLRRSRVCIDRSTTLVTEMESALQTVANSVANCR